MKKGLWVMLLVIVAFGFAGCGKKSSQTTTTGGDASQAEISSIEQAKKSGKKMTCTSEIKDANGDYGKTTVYIDGEKYRTETDSNGLKTYTIFDGAIFWSWSSESNEGMKMEKSCMDEMNQASENNSSETYQEMDETFVQAEDLDTSINVKCTAGANFDLTPPSDINFADYCAMMKDAMDMMNSFSNGLPEGWVE